MAQGGKLVNPFHWSRSRVQCFNECRRKYYLRYYRHWGGWDSAADEESRLAYRLGKMVTLPMAAGSAVHEVLARHFRARMSGSASPLDPEEPVRIMRRLWRDAQAKKWEINPKKHPPLFEVYYDQVPPREKLAETAAKARRAVSGLTALELYQGLSGLSREDYLWLDTAGGAFSQATVFESGSWKAISNPDLVVRLGERALIIDWKTGSPRPEDELQVAADGLWARRRLGEKADEIEACLVYLASGEVRTFSLGPERLETMARTIGEDMERMAACLADPGENIPLDEDRFPLHNDLRHCSFCPFQEICLSRREDDYT